MTEASWTPEPSDDKLHDECGVFGVWAPNRDPVRMAYFGLRALQHRGQESAGIAVGDGRTVLVRKDLGLVTQVFSEADLAARWLLATAGTERPVPRGGSPRSRTSR